MSIMWWSLALYGLVAAVYGSHFAFRVVDAIAEALFMVAPADDLEPDLWGAVRLFVVVWIAASICFPVMPFVAKQLIRDITGNCREQWIAWFDEHARSKD